MKSYVLMFLCVFSFFCGKVSSAEKLPFDVAEIYSENKITGYHGQNLILLDFWATWCVPCRTATRQLEIMQDNIPDDVFIVSVTDETHEVVEKYMKKNAIELMVVLDSPEKELVKKFKVKRRPYAVLLSTAGKVLWEGHPGDLTSGYVRNVASRYRTVSDITMEDFFNVVTNSIADEKEVPVISLPLSVKTCGVAQPYFRSDYNNVEFIGKVSSLIAKLYNVSVSQVVPNQWENVYVHFEGAAEIWNARPDSVLKFVTNNLHLSISSTTSVEDVCVMEVVDENKLWNKNQLRMGEENVSTFLAGTSRLQADNTSIGELCVLLSDEKKKYFRYIGGDYNLYDWDFQFVYDNLMADELLNEFGIKLRETRMEIPYFNLK